MAKPSTGPADFVFPQEDVLGDPLQNRHPLTVSDFVLIVNDTLEANYEAVEIVGEVASFKVNQGKWVFFDLKDEETSISCFMTLWSLRQPLEDGMKVVVRGTPKLTKWGKFSLTVSAVRPAGEGSLKKAFEILKKKLAGEGLFDPAKKRGIPEDLTRLGVISSTQAAGYADFVKIINARWGGMKVVTAHTQVQGMDAPDQIIRALQYFNERSDVQMIAILRGGGSADDLSCFNDEKLVRAVAASKIPVICGIGHEVDESLCDLACDVRASTPSNAAEMLTPDRNVVKAELRNNMQRVLKNVFDEIENAKNNNRGKVEKVSQGLIVKYIEPKLNETQKIIIDVLKNIKREFEIRENYVKQKKVMLEALNPEVVLRQGYAILSGKVSPGSVVKITTYDSEITTLIQEIIKRRKNE